MNFWVKAHEAMWDCTKNELVPGTETWLNMSKVLYMQKFPNIARTLIYFTVDSDSTVSLAIVETPEELLMGVK